MDTVGLRELRQDASGLVRRVEAGEEFTITVSGRPSARLVPVRATRWCVWEDVAAMFDGAPDAEWQRDRDLVRDDLRDPWSA